MLNSNRSLFRIGAVLALIGISACEEIEQVQDRFRDLTPHEAYQASLSDAGLTSTALGRDWILAGQQAVQAPVEISLPFREAGFITPEEPRAVGYRLTIGRGQRLTASVSLKSGEETRVFVDLFRMAENEDDPPRPILSTDSVPGTFEHEPWRGGDFLLRIQPELLRGGTYTVTLRLEAQLAFPVDGHGVRSIQSAFGANRDAGRRSHDGVDIFAPKGTPVLAISAGRVSRVQVTNLGGKVVWVRDPIRNSNLYYAHLDSQAVSRGQEVELGDTLGFVGNTGNARTTPPHLHFGIYRRGEGPVNPDPFLRPPRGALAKQTADLGHLGEWVRLLNDGIRLRATPERRGEILRELGQYTPLHVLGGSGEYFRVRLPDGAYGYVASHLTEPTDLPLGSEVAARNQMILSGPSYAASVIVQLDAGTEVPILGRYEGYLYVRTPSGQTGWMGEQQQ